jgi:dTDP-4-dehydrorhamnose reductase
MRLFVFGLGFSALQLIRTRRGAFETVAGTVRTEAKRQELAGEGIAAFVFDPPRADRPIRDELRWTDALLVSIPPGPQGDPVLASFADTLAEAPDLTWIGYLSTIGVYGDHGGAWVDETTPRAPVSRRSRERAEAERAWLDFGARSGKAVHVFRLAGIYGPGRNALANVAAGTARRIVKPGQVFNRIHVDDIAAILLASIRKPRPGAIYNVADDEPAPPQDVVAFAAGLAGVESPPDLPFEEADLSPMAASFYAENKRASNRLIKEELGVALRYPTYREGLTALRGEGEGS